MTVYEIDGANFSTLEGFYEEFSGVVIPGVFWGHSPNAFDDVLYGGFGTPDDGFVLRWKNHDLSRQSLGPTDFDLLVEILTDHGPGGHDRDHVVKLELA